jgi:hypothetical protein
MTSFLDFFSNVAIQKYKTDPVSGVIPHKFVRVPIQWASTEKWLQVLKSQTARKGFDPDIVDRNPVELQWQLPRMSVNMTSMDYDPMRHLCKTVELKDYINDRSKKVYAPVPYNLSIDLSIIARNIDECLQVVEQIIPFFTPSLSLDIKLFDDKPSESIPFILSTISPDITEELSELDERVFIFILTFIVKTNYYLPKRVSSSIINQIDTNYFLTDSPVSADPSFSKFEQYVQVAKNPDPYGEFADRTDPTLNPVYKMINIVNNLGEFAVSGAVSGSYEYNDGILYNDMHLRYVGASGWGIPAVSANVMLTTPTSADSWVL